MLRFKQLFLEIQFMDYYNTAPLVRTIFIDLAAYVWTKFKKDIWATCFHRTEEEQKEQYKAEIEADPNFKVPYSPHCPDPVCEAGDISIILSHLVESEIGEIIAYVHKRFPRKDGLKTIFRHKTKSGVEHLHIQVQKNSADFA